MSTVKNLPRIRCLITAWPLIVALGAGPAQAATVTNSMTNIVTVADACDVVAIGMDFGVMTPGGQTLLPAVALLQGNTDTNATAPNADTGHPDAGADGSGGTDPDSTGSTNDDDLTINTGLPLIQGAVNTLLTNILATALGSGALPGIVVACTVAPTDVTLTSEGGQSVSLDELATTTFSGTMSGVGGGAGVANELDYELQLLGAVPDVSAITGTIAGFTIFAYTVTTGSILADQTGNDVVPGFYTDAAIATVEF